MPQIPTSRDLGQIKVNGRANPANINPNVALDIGKAGAAYAHAGNVISAAFSGLAEKQQAMDDATWLSDSKIALLTNDDAIRRDTELNAGADGTGYEQAPIRLDQSVKEIEAKPGGSTDARAKFKLYAAERGYDTGRWAANTAQTKLKDFTTEKLDRRLNEMTNLASNNPDQAKPYFDAYQEEVNAHVGTAISASDASIRIEQARSNILKAATTTKAIKNPADFGKAVSAIREAGAAFEQDNPETRAAPTAMRTGPQPASVSFELETGKKDPLKGVANISADAHGTKSYGNFGINSGGSAQRFVAQYGSQFGLTAKPGTPEFDKQWKNAAGASPVELHDAEMEWWDAHIGTKISNNLVRAGIPSDVASDPRVVAYFADRSVQQGEGSIANHADRIKDAFAAAKGDPARFLSSMSAADRKNYRQDFPAAIKEEKYSEKGSNNRIAGRERLSLAVGSAKEAALPRTEAERAGYDTSKIPAVAGTIQPQELLQLSPKDYQDVVHNMAPFLQTEMKTRMEGAMSAIEAKGSQNLITPKEIDDAAPIIGAETARQWKDALRNSQEMFVATATAKNMTPEQRYTQLSQLVPTGNPEDLAGDERRRYELFAKAVQGINQAIKKDPYGYFTVENESGRQAAKQLAGAPTGQAGTPLREQAFDTLIQLQKREGIAPDDIRILSKAQAENYATRLGQAKTGPAATMVLEDLRQTYGKHFNQLWGELVESGASPRYLALRTATRTGQDAVVQSIALEKAMDEAGAKGGRKSLLVERSGLKVTDLNKAVANELSTFAPALQYKTNTNRLTEAYRSSLETLTAYYVIQGKNLGDAASQAGKDLFKDNLKMIGSAAVPAKIYEEAGREISRSLGNIPNMIAPIEDQIIAPIRASNGQYPPGHEQQRYINNIKANGQFITKEDGSGVYLLDGNGDYVLHDTPDGAQPASWSWEVLGKLERHFDRTNLYGVGSP